MSETKELAVELRTLADNARLRWETAHMRWEIGPAALATLERAATLLEALSKTESKKGEDGMNEKQRRDTVGPFVKWSYYKEGWRPASFDSSKEAIAAYDPNALGWVLMTPNIGGLEPETETELQHVKNFSEIRADKSKTYTS